jgi:hypothetical protein
MQNWEALKAITEKKCVRHETWTNGAHITADLRLEPCSGLWAFTAEGYLTHFYDGWEIYDPRTEDDVDRRAACLLFIDEGNRTTGNIREQLVLEFGKPLVERAEARACSR